MGAWGGQVRVASAPTWRHWGQLSCAGGTLAQMAVKVPTVLQRAAGGMVGGGVGARARGGWEEQVSSIRCCRGGTDVPAGHGGENPEPPSAATSSTGQGDTCCTGLQQPLLEQGAPVQPTARW